MNNLEPTFMYRFYEIFSKYTRKTNIKSIGLSTSTKKNNSRHLNSYQNINFDNLKHSEEVRKRIK